MADGYALMNAAANMYGNGNKLQDPTANATQMPQGDPQLDAVINQPNSSPLNPEDADNQQYQEAANQAAQENAQQTSQALQAAPKAGPETAPDSYGGMAGVRKMQGTVFKNPYHF